MILNAQGHGLVKDESWSGTGRLPTLSDRCVSVYGGWLCFGDKCMSLDV